MIWWGHSGSLCSVPHDGRIITITIWEISSESVGRSLCMENITDLIIRFCESSWTSGGCLELTLVWGAPHTGDTGKSGGNLLRLRLDTIWLIFWHWYQSTTNRCLVAVLSLHLSTKVKCLEGELLVGVKTSLFPAPVLPSITSTKPSSRRLVRFTFSSMDQWFRESRPSGGYYTQGRTRQWFNW